MHAHWHMCILLCKCKDIMIMTSMSPWFIDTLNSLIQWYTAKIRAYAHKKIVCINTPLCALVMLSAKKLSVCSPNYIDTLFSMIWPNFADMYMGPCTQKYSLLTPKLVWLDHIMCSDMTSMFPWFHRYLYISNETRIGWYICLCI